MDLRDYVRTLGKRWRIVVLMALLGIAGAVAATLLTTPTYQAKTQLFVSTTTGSSVSDAVAGSSFAQQRVKSYAEIIDSPRVLNTVVNDLNLDVSATELASRVKATVPLGTTLINVSVEDTNAEQAAKIADAVSAQFARYVGQIETPTADGTSLVKVSVVRPAEVPGTPISPRTKLNLALGLIVGLALGIGLALLRESIDTTMKSEDDLEDVARTTGQPLPILGSIAKDPAAAKRPLIVHSDPQSPRAEAFRQVRTNLQFVDIDNPPRSIVITSSLPEEGKSTTAANLAITLAQAGLRVALVEADLRRPRLATYMGLEGAAGLTDVLVGRAKLQQMLVPWGGLSLSVLPSGRSAPNPSELLGSHAMLSVIRELEQTFDIVLLDAPPLLPVTDAAVMSALAGGAILIVRLGSTTHDQVESGVESLKSVDARLLGVVMTMGKAKSARSTYGYDYSKPEGGSSSPASSGRRSSGGARDVVPTSAEPTRRGRGRR